MDKLTLHPHCINEDGSGQQIELLAESKDVRGFVGKFITSCMDNDGTSLSEPDLVILADWIQEGGGYVCYLTLWHRVVDHIQYGYNLITEATDKYSTAIRAPIIPSPIELELELEPEPEPGPELEPEPELELEPETVPEDEDENNGNTYKISSNCPSNGKPDVIDNNCDVKIQNLVKDDMTKTVYPKPLYKRVMTTNPQHQIITEGKNTLW